MTKKLKLMPYAQAHVLINDDEIHLVSYTTVVISIKNNWLQCHGLYSQTTRKHISAFMREYTSLSYTDAKCAYENNYIINIETGEIKNYEAY